MRDIFCVDYRDAIRSIVRKELKLNYGIKVPKTREKEKQKTSDDYQNKSKHFGVLLDRVPSRNVKSDQYFSIPIFLVEAFDYLNDHLGVEGLFRKSGSAGRQKSLREILERRGTFLGCDLLHPHDVASLVKQFFRELPNPLLTNHLSSTFLKCLNLSNLIDSHNALLLCCLLLPDEHLRVLMYLVDCINEVANHSLESKMSIRNLGIVFAPNLLCVSGKERNCEKTMRETTLVVDFIFQNPDKIGMVPDYIIEKSTTMHIDGAISTSSGDELEDNSKRIKSLVQQISHDKNRDRSKSIKGLFCRGFRSADRNIGKISPKSWLKHGSLQKVSSSLDDVNNMHYLSSSSISSNGSGKRQSSGELSCGPVRKSPRLDNQSGQIKSYSMPLMTKVSNQYSNSKGNQLHYEINLSSDKYGSDTPILSSKFGRAQNRGSPSFMHSDLNQLDSDMEIDQNETPRPQSKITRQTQKPQVKISRRSSSLDRRRARYQSATPKMRRKLPKTPLSENTKKSPFQDENLTVSIVFMKSYNIPKDVDSVSFDNDTMYSTRNTRLPRWKSDVTASVNKRDTNNNDCNSEFIKKRRNSRRKSREKVKKSYSMVERSVSRVY